MRRTVQFQPLLSSDCDWPGRRQPLNVRGPLDGKPTVADLEDDPIADYIVSGGRLAKLGDALQCFRVAISCTISPSENWSDRESQ